MDPVSQAFIGSAFAQTFAKKTNQVKLAFGCGAIGGILPDIDIFIKSASDPLLAIQYHRHFTHSLFFVPIGGLVAAILIWLIFSRKKDNFLQIYLFSTLGYFTHGLLDSCTAYGTQILWPFSDYRATWNLISIIDPLFTIPLIGFSLISLKTKSYKIARSGIYLCLIYLLYGFHNQISAKEHIEKIAEERGHKIERLFISPTFANNVLWRTIYQDNDKYYIDSIRVSFFKDPIFNKGTEVKVINKETIFSKLPSNSVQRNDIRRFAHFAKDFIYIDPKNSNIIADLRYSKIPNQAKPMWGIIIDESSPQNHAIFTGFSKK